MFPDNDILGPVYSLANWGGPDRDRKQGGGGGLFGLGDFGTMGLMSLGGNLLGGVAGLLAGETEQEKRGKKVFRLAENRLGQDVLNPDQYLADFYRSQVPEWNRMGENVGKRLGLDSGVAQGAMIDMIQPSIAKFMMNAKMQNDMLTSQQDSMLLSLMAGLGR